MKAVIYCRVSTKEQAQNLSLPTQLKACREYCARENYDIAAEFTDAGESAKTTDRREFLRLLEFCRLHKRDVRFVVFYNITRFSRNSVDYAVVRNSLQRLGISIRSVNEPISDDSMGSLMGTLLAAIAQFDNDEKARRTKVGMKAALELGRWTFQAPVGYQKDGVGRKGVLVRDPVRAPLVSLAFKRYATGRSDKNAVLRSITGLGLTTQAGKPLSPQSFGALLRNPIYAGWISVPKWGVNVRGDFEALVPDALFRRVQRLLDGKGEVPRPHSRNHPDYPLRRFVACALCNTPLTGSWSKGRAKKYAYYHCPKCRQVKATKKALEDRFLELLEKLKPEARYMRLFRAIVLDVWNQRSKGAAELRTMLEAAVRERRERLDRVDEAFLHERSIDRQTYERQRDQLREQLTISEMELSDAVVDQLDVEGILGFAEQVLVNASRLWTEVELDQKQQLQQVLFPQGLKFDGHEFGTAVTCLAFRQLDGNGESKSEMASPTGFEPVFWP
jgi:site-specific DNA recombinase